MKHSDDYNAAFAGVIEECIRKAMEQDPAECSLNNLKSQGSFLDESDGVVYPTDKVISKFTRDVSIPCLGFA